MANDIGIKIGLDGVPAFAGGIDTVNAKIGTLGRGADAAGEATSRGFTNAAQGVRSISEQLDNARTAVLGYFTVSQAMAANSWVTQQASDLRQLQDRVKSVTSSSQEAGDVFASLFAQSNKWGSAVDETANAFARLNPVVKSMGLGSGDTLRMLDGLSASLRLSGATTAETTAVLLQFSQAMGSGRVGGDEFRSMMENALPLMTAVAEKLGVSTGGLRQMAEDGKLTSSVFANALMPAIEGLTQRAEQIAPTVGQAMQALKNNALKDFGREFEGSAKRTGEMLTWLSEHTLEFAAAAHAATDAVLDLGKKAAVAAGVGAVGAMALSMSGAATAAGGLALALKEVNLVSAALVGSAAIKSLERMSTFGKAGLLGAVFFGAYEFGAWIGEMQTVRGVIGDLLEPVFRAYDIATGDTKRKAIAGVEDAKKQLADLQALKAQGVTAQFQETTILGTSSKKLVPIDDLIAQATANEQKLTAAYQQMYAAPAKAQAAAAPVNRASAAGEYESLTKDLKYREKIIAEYNTKLLNLQQSYADKVKGLSGKQLEDAQKAQAQYLAALLRERKSALEGAGDFKDAKEAARIKLDARIAGYEREQEVVTQYERQAQDTLKSFRDTDLISESTYLERKRDLALQANAEQVALIEKEKEAVKNSGAALDPKERLAAQEKYNTELKKLAGERSAIAAQFANAMSVNYFKETEANRKGLEAEIAALDKSNEALRLHNEEIGLTTEQLNALILKRQDNAIATLQAKVDTDRAAEAQGIYNDTLQEEIDKLERLKKQRQLTADGQIKQQAADSAKSMADEWKKGWEETDRIARDAFTSWAEGGVSMADTIGKALKKALLSAIYEATLKPLVLDIYTSVVGSKSGGSMTGGVLNTLGSLANGKSDETGIAGTIISSAGLFSSGFKAGLGAVFGESGTLGAFSAGTTAIGAGNLAGGFGTLAGAAAPWLAGAAVLKSLTDYSVKSDGSALVANIGSKGLSGEVARRDDFTQSSSGILSGGTTHNSDWSRAGDAVDSYINSITKSATVAAQGYASALGLPVQAIDGFTKQIEVSITGLDPAGQKAAIDKAVSGFLDEMVTSAYGTSLQGLSKSGETSSQTLQRLAVDLVAVNGGLDKLGLSLLPVGVEGAKAAAGLVEAFGGLDQASAAFGAYYDKFYSDSEKAAYSTQKLSEQFAALGLEMPGTQADFKALVSSIDITTESGQKLAAAVIGLAPAFDSAAQAARAAANNMLSAIQNWGSSSDVRAYQAQILQKNLADAGLSLSMDQIMGATQTSALDFYKSLDPSSVQAQALLKYQQDIFNFVGGQKTSGTGISSGGGSSGGGGGGAGETAADSIAKAWQSITDSIWGEVKRIRGLLEGTGEMAYAAAQARFATATAMARAGDSAAAKDLPQLSQNVLALAENNARTLLELQRARAQTSGSLSDTATLLSTKFGLTIPAFASGGVHSGGWSMVGEDGPELAYLPPARIYNAGDTQSILGGLNLDALLAELQALREENGAVREELRAIRLASENTSRLTEKADSIGAPPARATL